VLVFFMSPRRDEEQLALAAYQAEDSGVHPDRVTTDAGSERTLQV
jgi:hypothetical protein